MALAWAAKFPPELFLLSSLFSLLSPPCASGLHVRRVFKVLVPHRLFKPPKLSIYNLETLDLKISATSRVEEAFFNQIVALSEAGLLVLANAKKNAIYDVHLEYGSNPVATRMDYIAEFTVTMLILSFTGTDDLLPNGKDLVQVYYVQTQAIEQCALDLSYKPTEIPLSISTPKPSAHDTGSESAPTVRHPVSSTSMDTTTSVEFSILSLESRPSLPTVTSNNDILCIAPTPLALSPRFSGKLSGSRSPTIGFEPGLMLDDNCGDKKVIGY
ncbi:transducin/WD40 repeat-like superfamily protein [Actinidia rufa]|uniref:Transducin/WD40 repeat-like superfamily protein n=1 Tax=Actinidia rufa TaxID=165716 RepID=A0A7J0DB84_9ERIC|nr:transducin/WD40 repeat-like superfamily protein [Actinidia rufa]